MKVEFEIECTPEEARKFLGLPDVVPMQDALMKQLQQRLSDNIRQLDLETLTKTWMPMTLQNFGDLQKMFWSQMGKPMQGGFNVHPFGSGDPAADSSASSQTTASSNKPKNKSKPRA